jgi:hypothetical protein
MGLDRFMGIDSKKPKKKTSKKTTSKKSSNAKPQVEEEAKKPKSKELGIQKDLPKPSVEEIEKAPSFTFVTMKFKCTNPKCKMKKTLRKPQSFTPTEKEIICPKCGSALKKSRVK